eukprot:MONOS_3702.1-p1 / transcript=MONOS_3702.1 / gene=MONOS_3702 / organism=Monocercomonoides_exilis_PA203 / gene_product=unspecified product / transcript_product=unspecified product / location=Mono_scaffold00090:23897-24280(-) / protein_length=104 / sequence_SO=supercontig / SO=protein_coding / is_pseudo=false
METDETSFLPQNEIIHNSLEQNSRSENKCFMTFFNSPIDEPSKCISALKNCIGQVSIYDTDLCLVKEKLDEIMISEKLGEFVDENIIETIIGFFDEDHSNFTV